MLFVLQLSQAGLCCSLNRRPALRGALFEVASEAWLHVYRRRIFQRSNTLVKLNTYANAISSSTISGDSQPVLRGDEINRCT
jgi:hypothetical protein